MVSREQSVNLEVALELEGMGRSGDVIYVHKGFANDVESHKH